MPAAPRRGAQPRKTAAIIWLLLGAAFVAILNETTMGVAIPHLIGDLGITARRRAVADDGVHADDGRRDPDLGLPAPALHDAAVFIAAMGLFSLGTLIAFLSPGFPMLLVARVVQASGTAIMMPLLMTTLMTARARRTRAAA